MAVVDDTDVGIVFCLEISVTVGCSQIVRDKHGLGGPFSNNPAGEQDDVVGSARIVKVV